MTTFLTVEMNGYPCTVIGSTFDEAFTVLWKLPGPNESARVDPRIPGVTESIPA